MATEQRLAGCGHEPWGPQELGEAGGTLAGASGGAPCHTVVSDFWPQNWERVHFFVLSHPAGGHLLRPPQDTDTLSSRPCDP